MQRAFAWLVLLLTAALAALLTGYMLVDLSVRYNLLVAILIYVGAAGVLVMALGAIAWAISTVKRGDK
jgi:hypothetical protein